MSTSASSQDFFQKVEIFIPLELVYTYVVTACSILLATSIQLQKYILFFFQLPQNGCHSHDCWIWHHPPFILVWRKIPKLVSAVLWTDQKQQNKTKQNKTKTKPKKKTKNKKTKTKNKKTKNKNKTKNLNIIM